MALLIIIIIVLAYFYYTKDEEIGRLKKKVRKLQKDNKILKEYVRRFINNPDSGDVTREMNQRVDTLEEPKVVEEERKTVTESVDREASSAVSQSDYTTRVRTEEEYARIQKEDNNTMILVTGAIFIIIAAVVFLFSTWFILPNGFKLIFLALFVALFLGLSKVADEKFNLPKASQTFFYIAMAYIPICLYAISTLGLLGDYLSINGEGRYIYLAFANILIAVIYYLVYRDKKSNILFYGSILAQYLSVIVMGLIFSESVGFIILAVAIYNLLISLVKDKFENAVVFDNVNRIVAVAITVITVFAISEIEKTIAPVIALVIAINYFLIEIDKDQIINSVLFNLFMAAAGLLFLANVELLDKTEEVLFLVYCFGLFWVENYLFPSDKSLYKDISRILFSLYLLVMGMFSNTIPVIIYPLLAIVVTFKTTYKGNESMKLYSSISFPLAFIVLCHRLVGMVNLSYHFYMVFAIALFVLFELLFRSERFKLLNRCSFFMNHINMFLTLLFVSNQMLINNIFYRTGIYCIVLAEIYGYSYFKDRDELLLFKYLDYIFTNVGLVFIFRDLRLEYIANIMPAICTLVIGFIEDKLAVVVDGERKEGKLFDSNRLIFEGYLMFNAIAAYFLMNQNKQGILLAVISSIFTVFLILRNNVKNSNIYYNIIPILFHIFTMEAINFQGNEALMLIIYFISIVGCTLVTYEKKTLNLFTVAGFVYTILLNRVFDTELVKRIILFIYTGISLYLVENDNMKDVLKGILIFIGCSIYFEILSIAELDNSIILVAIGSIVTAMLFLRGVVKKHTSDLSVIEYIVYTIMYLAFIPGIHSLSEAFGIMVIQLVTMFSCYYLKYGSAFIVNTIMLILYGLYLTRMFWLLIPWWMYLLGIGIILVMVASKNEAKNIEERKSIGKIINDIKENIEK